MADCDPILHLIPFGSRGAEIGVARGVSSEQFLERKATLLLVDPWMSYPGYAEELGSRGAYDECMRRIAIYKNWTALRMMSAVAAQALVQPKPFDWVFIDGNHEYTHVLQDCREWWRHIADGGWLLGHDYNLHCFDYGVKRAVDRFAREVDLDVQVFSKEGVELQCWGIQKRFVGE